MARSASARTAKRGSVARSRARSRSPPAAAAIDAASAASTPSAVSRSITSASGTGPRSMRTDRLAMVTSSGGTSSARITKKVDGGGSSTYLRRIAPNWSMRWKSSSTSTLRSPSAGDRAACFTIALAVGASMRPWAVVASTMWRSGCVSASARRWWRSASSPSLPAERSSAAKALAAPRLPDPDGPTSRYEWTGWAAAAVSWAMACGCPTTSAHTSMPVAVAPSPPPRAADVGAAVSVEVGEPDARRSPDGVGDLVLGAGAVDDRPAVGVLHGLEEEAVVHAAVERVAGRLEAVLGAARAVTRRRRGSPRAAPRGRASGPGSPSATAARPRRPGAGGRGPGRRSTSRRSGRRSPCARRRGPARSPRRRAGRGRRP